MSVLNKIKQSFTKVNIGRVAPAIAVGVLIFAAGIGIGQGRFHLGPDAALHKSVSGKLPENLDYTTVEQVYDSLRANYDGDLKAEDLLTGLKEGLVKAAGDPYTDYFTPTEAKDFNSQLSGTFTGIGAELSKDGQNIVIIAPLAGYPADKAGLKPKDVIAQIDGKSATDMSVSDAVSKIRGQAGTTVKLKVIRDNTQVLDFSIVRTQIQIPSVKYEILPGNIGYMKISTFGEDTITLAKAGAQSFADAKVKGVILDMRSDPGGLLDAAVSVSSLWLQPGKTILQEKRGGVVVKTYSATGTPILNGVKTAVLIDGGSASASEITAGALRDNDAATLIGIKSFGKGSVQSLVNLGDDSMLKVTIARWFTPAGKNIDKQGISPDQEVKISDEDVKAGNDPQKDAALQFLSQ